MTPSRQHAIVIGASVGGLCTARALSEIFDHVTVIDRDELPSEPVARRGVPRSRQLRFLLVRGREALDELFPGVSEELIRAGAVAADMQAEFNWNFVGHPMRKAPSDLIGIGVTRSLLEFTLRSRVMRLPTVTVIERCDVTGLRADPHRRRVTGVRARSRADTRAEITLGADLVVDACGRGTRSATWLEDLQRYRAVAVDDAVLAAALLRVFNLLDEPSRLSEPDLRARVSRGAGPVVAVASRVGAATVPDQTRGRLG